MKVVHIIMWYRWKKIINNVNYIMVITDGCIYSKLEKFSLFTAPGVKITFKKASVDSINNSYNNIIVIAGDNDAVMLN